MRRFAADIPLHQHYVLQWGVQRNTKGEITVGLGAGDLPKTSAGLFEDKVDGVPFYWRTQQSNVGILRKQYCVDYENGKRTRVIPLEQ
jgi:hypothetical protein